MNFGICPLSIIPCRAEPSDKSEMVTQLLFGENFKIIEKQNQWIKILTSYENYSCWIDVKQALEIDEETYSMLNKPPQFLSGEIAGIAIQSKTNEARAIVLGSSLPFYNYGDFLLDTEKYIFEGQAIDPSEEGKFENIPETAFMYLNTPYLWGGRTPFGIDCSGFTQMVYKLNGIFIPRDAYQQAEMGETLSFIEEAIPGDLAFFDNEEGKITHVGIVLENQNIIHASGKVRIDKFDHQGIFNTERGNYTHNLRLIKHL
ncbi:MAG: C40 family peptidase [Flavobacteriales bacterium]|nr:C40 family peptidase [Flavobacteriales bacterium]